MIETGKQKLASIPTLQEEQKLISQGFRYVCGIDEVGRGCLAGPITAASVILPNDFSTKVLSKVRDSKLLSAKSRSQLFHVISATALYIGIGVVEAEEIDNLGINLANNCAMVRSIENLKQRPDYLLVDAVNLSGVSIPDKSIIHGDATCLSIACASIIAKVNRDSLMISLDETYPGYGFGMNKGYGTKMHFEALEKFGPCPIHRRTFSPVNKSK